MQVILFVGHHKVGSSALQTYLSQNALALLRQGILYPATESQGLATLLERAMSGGDRPDVPMPVNMTEAHNALAFRMISEANKTPVPALHKGLPGTPAMFKTIERQIEIFEPKVVILAAEVFANFAAISPAMITRLGTFFEGADITITATLRRIDDYLISWHGQRLRFGQAPRALPDALGHYYQNIHFDYRKMLSGWIEQMPEARLRLRPYDKVMASGGSVQDFMSLAGLPMPTDPARARRVNESLHRGLIEIARRGNAALEPAVAHRLFLSLLQLGPKLDLPPAAEVEMFGATARSDLVERFAPIHDWLSEINDAPFFADITDIARLRPQPEPEVTHVALERLRKRHMTAIPEAARDFIKTVDPSSNS